MYLNDLPMMVGKETPHIMSFRPYHPEPCNMPATQNAVVFRPEVINAFLAGQPCHCKPDPSTPPPPTTLERETRKFESVAEALASARQLRQHKLDEHDNEMGDFIEDVKNKWKRGIEAAKDTQEERDAKEAKRKAKEIDTIAKDKKTKEDTISKLEKKEAEQKAKREAADVLRASKTKSIDKSVADGLPSNQQSTSNSNRRGSNRRGRGQNTIINGM
jgi:hypothetical protein